MRGVGAGCESLIWVFSEQLSSDMRKWYNSCVD